MMNWIEKNQISVFRAIKFSATQEKMQWGTMLSSFQKQSRRTKYRSRRSNIASRKYYIEYRSKSFENKEYIKPKVVLWKCYAVFPVWFSSGKLCMKGRYVGNTRPDLSVFPETGNNVSALVEITMITQCQMKTHAVIDLDLERLLREQRSCV